MVGKSPTDWKLPLRVFLQVKHKNLNLTTYRSISLLSNFSKFFEKVMYNRMNEFAEQYNTLYRCQFEFLKNHSTSHALIHLMKRISSAIDQRETTVGVFLDLSKAFNTLDHQILFTKLEHYGIRDVALQWRKSYFSCRQQLVQINQTCSLMQTIKGGAPQGSILGPLFFILYINDLPKASKLTELLLFAEDTSIFFSQSNPNYLENVLNNELLNIDVWLRCNKLLVNIKLRQIMLTLVRVRGNSVTVFLSLLEVNL